MVYKNHMILKAKFVLFFLLGVIHFAKAQDTINYNYVRKNNICIEFGGTGLVYSVNYEHNLFIKKCVYQSVKAGVSLPFVAGIDQIFIPIDYNFYFGKGKFKILFGAGIIGLIGTHPSPSSISERQDYLKLYNSNHYVVVNKYGTNPFEKAFDLAYTAKLGFKYVGRLIDFYAYYNCFYIRYSTTYNFQPVWFGTGISLKLGKK
jgi:hypothetical protein